VSADRQQARTNKPSLDISAIVPVGARRDDLARLIDEYAEGLRRAGASFEVIVVMDGPRDDLMKALERMIHSRPWLRAIELSRGFGEAAALTAGFSQARGRLMLTLPAYYQVDPGALPNIIAAGAEADMVIAVRSPRAGSAFEHFRRNAFHGFLGFITGQRYRDLGCGVRLLKREIVAEIPLYSERHRFYPALAHSRGFKVREVEARQSPLDDFRGRYRLREYLHRVLDILTLFFLVRFTKKPLRFFGTVGFVVGALGLLFLAVLVVQRLFFGVALADRPALLLSSLMLVLGVQVFALGLLGELIIFTHAKDLKEYAVRRVIGGDRPEKAA
jgi:glycosyltransferase involved in cell wall biosynthesis